MEQYRKYFDIDPDFFPAVNNDIIKKDPDLWKKYYPHQTFIKLLNTTISVLNRSQKLNIWVEGAYGTGKSHAVLTLKRLLDASEKDVRDYFDLFNLDKDLCNKLLSAKNDKHIITVHRYGSSSIHSDNDLFLAMQESITDALKSAGIENAGPNALKEGVIKYLSDEENKQSFGIYVRGSYSELFGNESIDDIIDHLQKYKEQALQSLMNKIFKVANEKNIKAFSLDDTMMVNWISEIIHSNNLKAIVFIWDEFTEYFSNNARRFTGFQHVLDMSQTEPFCFIPVTHMTSGGLDDSDPDKKKILGRFINPTCRIELPENMAFQLMGAALQKSKDEVVKKEWNEILWDLQERTINSRKYIKNISGIDDNELCGILPIHPYTACVLKHISTSFAANQRSMFDFIKNSGNIDLKGFQWFIDNYGPYSENPFLTVDMLWGFFYDNGKSDLSQSIRAILDRYGVLSKTLDDEEKTVLKTILLMQAVWQASGSSVKMLQPSDKNLEFAFDGTDMEGGQATKCAEKLIRDKIIYKKDLKDPNEGNYLYSVLIGDMDTDEIEKKKAEYIGKTTSALIKIGELDTAIDIPVELSLRYKVSYAGATDFDNVSKELISKALDDNLHFYALVSLVKNDSESAIISKKIQNVFINHPNTEVIFIDCSKSMLGDENFAQWVEEMATQAYFIGKNNNEAQQHSKYAQQVLVDWKKKIKIGQFLLYTKDRTAGEIITTMDSLCETLMSINRKRFSLAIECNYKYSSNWWLSKNLQLGAECGITKTLKSLYNNNNAKLNVMLENAWDTPEYWIIHPADPVSRMKAGVEDLIKTTLESNGRISIQEIYNKMQEVPFGFLPCNYTAFFLGFLLKEYVDNKYTWSDGTTTDAMTTQKMKEMIEEVIKNDMTPISRYRDKFIVTMTPEEKAFAEGTAFAFEIEKSKCSSIESARDRIRAKMKETLAFPIWVLSYMVDEIPLLTTKDIIVELIDDYKNLANNTTNFSDNDIANSIGRKYIKYPNAIDDMHSILSIENCKKGMLKYINSYRDGKLCNLANSINDGGQYINAIKKKIDAEDAIWLWKNETVEHQIDITIVEYQIAYETSKIIGNCNSYKNAIKAWNDKTGNVKLSLETIKDLVPGLLQLLSKLRSLQNNNDLPNEEKQQFVNLIVEEGKLFNKFYSSQIDYFKNACSFYLSGLNDIDIQNVFKNISSGCFSMDNATYTKMVENEVEKYKKELESSKLKSLWKEKTKTDSPYKWSIEHKMPILAMIPDNEIQEARKVFSTLNNPNPIDKEVNKALVYLNGFNHWEELSCEETRNNAFRNRIMGDVSVLGCSVEYVKQFLLDHVAEAPYNWMGNPQVQKMIRDLGQQAYNKNGCDKAISIIDSMPEQQVKNYLKDLIKNNMIVGLQIIKNVL